MSIILKKSNLYTESVILQPQDLYSLKAIPFELVPSQGEGNIIIPTMVKLKSKFVTTIYKYSNEAILSLYIGGINIPGNQQPFILGIAGNAFCTYMVTNINAYGTLLSDCDNQPLFFKNDGAPLSEGDGLLYVDIDFLILESFTSEGSR